uniref:Uncharacterized protein n=1 Tax=Zea mays TaxID=4577 RepID=B6U0J5_MAIZE|nr:hypothetical protein [Zea mays]ACG46073.1 hypothetical protein [Zea mays]
MASGAAAPVKMSTAVTACILLAVLLPMAPKLVMGDCSGSCVTLCDTFADGFCTGNADPAICPPEVQELCHPTVFTGCITECNTLCATSGFAPCAA